jgi:hypothetical protein
MKLSWRNSLLGLGVFITFAVAIAFVLFVGQLPKEQEFESDGWHSKTLPTTLGALPVPKGALPFTTDAGGFRPKQELTPGAIFEDATLSKIKAPLYSKSVRNVPESEKKQVFERYGIDYSKHAGFEVDHLVPLSWGGSNAVSNLWPQPYAGEYNAHVKDALEVHGLKLIREGKLDLREAQKQIAADWIAMFKKYVANDPSERARMIQVDDDWPQ